MSATVDSRLHVAEADLVWYFGRAAVRFERSIFGSMLDMLVVKNSGSRKCPELKCQDGIRWDLKCEVHEWRDSEGTKHRHVRWRGAKKDDVHETNECQKCKGTGFVATALRGRKPTRTGYRKCRICKGRGEDDRSEICHVCGGAGYVVRPPAWQTRGTHGGAGIAPDDTTLQRSARVSRRLSRAAEQYPPAAVVMGLLYSDDGLRWAQRGRPLLVLYPFTRAGRKLCRSTQTDVTRGRLEAALTSTEPGTLALMAQALVEATEMARLSREAYHAAA